MSDPNAAITVAYLSLTATLLFPGFALAIRVTPSPFG
jgi:hypothetical protein